jgi:hypothetical protein
MANPFQQYMFSFLCENEYVEIPHVNANGNVDSETWALVDMYAFFLGLDQIQDVFIYGPSGKRYICNLLDIAELMLKIQELQENKHIRFSVLEPSMVEAGEMEFAHYSVMRVR